MYSTIETYKCNLNTNLNDVMPALINELAKLIKNNWATILENLRYFKNGKQITEETKLNISKKPSPAKAAIDLMKVKAITLADIYEAFEEIKYEDGLIFFNKPEKEIIILNNIPKLVELEYGDELLVNCHFESFPIATCEYYKNGKKICNGTLLKKEHVESSDCGHYKCLLTQVKKNKEKIIREFNFEVKIKRDHYLESLKIYISPEKQFANLGSDVKITASANENDFNKIEFKWFKLNEYTLQDEAISETENPSSNLNELAIKNLSINDCGLYKCLGTRKSTNEKVYSSDYSKLFPVETSEIDIKIALLIGNEKYNMIKIDSSPIRNCNECEKNYGLSDLNVEDSFRRLKKQLEDFGYLVMCFVNVDVYDYLRVLRLFRNMWLEFDRVSVLVYVAGHGRHAKENDFLIPVDMQILFHNNQHNIRKIYPLRLCSLNNLFENFKPQRSNQKISVVCFWDLCREECDLNDIGMFPSSYENIDYSIMFSCCAKKKAYELNSSVEECDLKSGSIFLNILLKHLKPNKSLYDIGLCINADMQAFNAKLLKYVPQLSTMHLLQLSNPQFHSNLGIHYLHGIADFNKNFQPIVDSYYYKNKKEYISYNGVNLISYEMYSDTFINSFKIEFEVITEKKLDWKVECENPLLIFKFDTEHPNKRIFKIENFLRFDGVNSSIKVFLHLPNENKKIETIIELPKEHIERIFNKLNTDEINNYIENKQNIDVNLDDFSAESITFSDDES